MYLTIVIEIFCFVGWCWCLYEHILRRHAEVELKISDHEHGCVKEELKWLAGKLTSTTKLLNDKSYEFGCYERTSTEELAKLRETIARQGSDIVRLETQIKTLTLRKSNRQ